MSYCRLSSDDWQCDVYVYPHVWGFWATHVASHRHRFDEPLPPSIEDDDTDAWVAREVRVMAMVKRARLEPIGLSHDGETYRDESPGECADRLEMLRAAGYNVPQYAIDSLREEEAE